MLLLPQASGAVASPEFSAAYGLGHPLVGTIVRLADATTLSPPELIQALLHTDVILLGEKHDNPDHHALQTWVFRQVIQAGRRPGVVFEKKTHGSHKACGLKTGAPILSHSRQTSELPTVRRFDIVTP